MASAAPAEGPDQETVRRLRAVVDQYLGLLTSARKFGGWRRRPSLALVLGRLREGCSGSRAVTKQLFDHLMIRMNHPSRLDVRLLVLPLLDNFFRASKYFRKLLCESVSQFVEATVHCRQVRPRGSLAPEFQGGPKVRQDHVQTLRARGLQLLETWVEQQPDNLLLRNALRLVRNLAGDHTASQSQQSQAASEEQEEPPAKKRKLASSAASSSSSSSSTSSESTFWSSASAAEAPPELVPDALDMLPALLDADDQTAIRRAVVVLRETFRQSEAGLPDLEATLVEAQTLVEMVVPNIDSELGDLGSQLQPKQQQLAWAEASATSNNSSSSSAHDFPDDGSDFELDLDNLGDDFDLALFDEDNESQLAAFGDNEDVDGADLDQLPPELAQAEDLGSFARRAGLGSKHFALEIEFDPADPGPSTGIPPEVRQALVDCLKSLSRRTRPRLRLWRTRLERCLPVIRAQVMREQGLAADPEMVCRPLVPLPVLLRLEEKSRRTLAEVVHKLARAERFHAQILELGLTESR